jgi:iron complex outermembrane recepter protein
LEENLKSISYNLVLLLSLLVLTNPIAGYSAVPAITEFSLEDLMNTEVTTLSRSGRPLSQSAAAVTVLTQEDIRRSGATTIPEALRNVPGLSVARQTANQWAISARGFNSSLANKMLVLIDGRMVYSRLHSGVYWDIQDMLLENIERIEIVRGPGGATWGSNAMNGIINIITKNSKDTQGTLLSAQYGTEEAGGGARYGGMVGEDLAYRGSLKYFKREASFEGNDAWHLGRADMRSDWQMDENDNMMFSGGYYNGSEDLRTSLTFQTAPFTQVKFEDSEIGGGHFLTRWNHTYSETSSSTLQAYYDQTNRASSALEEIRYIGDIDWQHEFKVGERNEVVWGLSYQLSADQTEGTFGAYFDPGHRADSIYSAFVQDTFAIIPDEMWFTFGSKFEINDYTGFEVQPSARLLWQFTERQSIWGAVSRAVSVPSRLDSDLVINAWFTPGTSLARLEGDSGKSAEEVIAYEAGYRAQPHERFVLDIAAFFNQYDHLRSLGLRDNFTEDAYTVQRLFIDDDADAYSAGTEVVAKIQASDSFRFDVGYSFIQLIVDGNGDLFNSAKAAETQTPEHQVFFRALYDLPHNIELDSHVRYISHLESPRVPSYWEMDVRLAWRPIPKVEFSVVGQSLFHNHHLEFAPSAAYRPEIERSVYGKTVVEF